MKTIIFLKRKGIILNITTRQNISNLHWYYSSRQGIKFEAITLGKIIAHPKKPHIFTIQGRKWKGKTEVPHVEAEIGV